MAQKDTVFTHQQRAVAARFALVLEGFLHHDVEDGLAVDLEEVVRH